MEDIEILFIDQKRKFHMRCEEGDKILLRLIGQGASTYLTLNRLQALFKNIYHYQDQSFTSPRA